MNEYIEMSKQCDLCFKKPKRFPTVKGYAYYFVIPKETGEVGHLMSSLKLAFKLCGAINHPAYSEEAFICLKCFKRETEATP